MVREKDYGPRDLILIGLGSAFTALGVYMFHHRPNQFRHEQKDKKISTLEKEVADFRNAIIPKLCIEVTEASWQYYKKNNYKGYIWRPSQYGKSEGIGHTHHIEKDHKHFPLLQAYFEKINNHKSKLAIVDANKHVLGNSCLGRRKVLDVTYRCLGYDPHKKEFTIPLFYQGQQDRITVEVKENEHQYLECK